MTHVTCRLTANNLDQLWNPPLSNRVWATFTLFYLWCGLFQNCFEDLLCYCEQCRSWSAAAVWRAGLRERTEVLVLADRCQPVQSCVLSTQSHATPAIVVVVDSVDCLLRHTSIGAVAIVCVVASAKVNHSAPAACDECSGSSHHELVAA